MTQLAIDATGPALNPALGQWWTPPTLARDLVAWAGVAAGMTVLEPTAGAGNLVRALPDDCDVTAVEIDSRWLPDLYTAHPRIRVIHGDFLALSQTMGGRFDLAIGNPPYEDALDARILLAAARRSLRVCAIVPLNAIATEVRYREAWSRLTLTRMQVCCTRPGFGGAHQNGMRDIAFVEVVERTEPRLLGECDQVAVGWRA